MCGATHEQKEMQAKQAAFYDTMTQQYNQVFAQHQKILDSLTAVFKPIFEKGPSQRGFAPEERTALDTQITDSTSRNYAAAKRALAEDTAARGGSDFVVSGMDEQRSRDLSLATAATQSDLENRVELADWQSGRNLWTAAAQGLGATAAELNPTGVAGRTTEAGSAAAETANQIAMASNSIWGSVLGALGGVAGAAVGGFTGGGAKASVAGPSAFPPTPGG